jgi:hypothetical protein
MVAGARPTETTIFVDPRGGDRALRVTWHHDVADVPDALAAGGLVVISLWRANLCVGSFRLEAHEVPDLVHALTKGLAPADGGSLSDTA